MAGTSITLCLPAEAAERVEEAVAEAMEPFYLDAPGREENRIWDSWRIVGRAFNVLPGHETDPRLVAPRPSRWGGYVESPVNDAGWCAGGPRELLDFGASTEEARQLADAVWLHWHRSAAELPAAQPYDVYYGRHVTEGCAYSRERAAADYWSQPLLRAYEEHRAGLSTARYSSNFLFLPDPVVQVGQKPRERFVEGRAAWALPRRNVLSLGGWWYEDGGPVAHGACRHRDECPHRPELPDGQQHIDRYLADLPGDTLLVGLHCHV
ncbi:hypothetical protein ACFV4G_11130 [Kitasatospora sp. NPDC059747]|uniref:hypothetical protein n=1 Tax=Kitasatospora sp. NPDC059747 TaxID=3346930 RepID=UPI003665C3D3